MWKLHKITVLMVLVMVIWSVICASASSSGHCIPKHRTHQAMQTDLNGRRCWDDVKIMTCWGYCHTYEISDWQFPYRKSHHPVCLYNERRHASVKLKNCDSNVEPGTDVYHYVEAASCSCQVCSSEDTSCEWLPPDTSLLGGLILKKESDEELDEELD